MPKKRSHSKKRERNSGRSRDFYFTSCTRNEVFRFERISTSFFALPEFEYKGREMSYRLVSKADLRRMAA